MDRTAVRTQPGPGVGALAAASRDGCAGVGPCGGEGASSIDGVLARLGAAQRLVARASQSPLADADGDRLAQVIAEGARLRSGVEALLMSATAAMETDRNGSGRAALRNEARMSARAAARRAGVSRQLADMPNVARGLAKGALTVEHAEVLADAARRSSPDIVDAMPGLLETAEKASPDLLRREAQAMLAQYDPVAAENQLSRQRRERSAALFTDSESGMGVLNARLDPISFALVKQAVENYNDVLWRLDGGRDGTPGELRDNRQRLADSVFEMLTNRRALAMGQRPVAASDGTALAVASDGTALAPARLPVGFSPGLPGGADGGECRSVTWWSPAQAPNQLVIVADIGVVDGTMPEGRCEVLGVGPVPASILDSLSPDTRITGAAAVARTQSSALHRCATAGGCRARSRLRAMR